MKFACKREELLKALSVATKLVKTRANLPVLANIMISTDKNKIKVSATDLESSVAVCIDSHVSDEGAITIPARTLLEFVQSSSDETIDIDSQDQDVRIKGSHNNATIKGIAADEFPEMATVVAGKEFKIVSDKLKTAIMAVAPAAALDETRPVLAGLYFCAGKNLKIASTDSYRLAEYTLKIDEPIELTAIIPQRTAMELARMLPQSGSSVSVCVGENQVQFKFDDTVFITRQIDGNFPDYQQIIPKEFVYEFNVSKEKFTEALRVASVFARESGNNIKLAGEQSKVLISAVSAQTGDSQALVEASTSGAGLEISFNAKFLLDGIASIGKEEIKMKFSGPLSPGLLVGEGDTSFRYIIMPLRSE